MFEQLFSRLFDVQYNLLAEKSHAWPPNAPITLNNIHC